MGKMQQKHSPETDLHILSIDLGLRNQCNTVGEGWALQYMGPEKLGVHLEKKKDKINHYVKIYLDTYLWWVIDL